VTFFFIEKVNVFLIFITRFVKKIVNNIAQFLTKIEALLSLVSFILRENYFVGFKKSFAFGPFIFTISYLTFRLFLVSYMVFQLVLGCNSVKSGTK